ncbi:MAG: hypothetical protein JW772_03215 [Candidatus Diapherotrites archaeon]|nr:hypothetical protein [Candidatus Diapherotrites archaeon]
MKKRILLALLIASIVLFSGCPEPPLPELECQVSNCHGPVECDMLPSDNTMACTLVIMMGDECRSLASCELVNDVCTVVHEQDYLDCLDAALCKGEGESIPVIANPPECCPGLTLIPPKEEGILGSAGICTSLCGNGNCDIETESSYNCPEDCRFECDKYHYSTCPSECIKTCIPSACDGSTCTADCDGPGSCAYP